jgi:hypothetical protein
VPLSDHFAPLEIELMRSVLEEAWRSLRPDSQKTLRKSDLAVQILVAANDGAKDREVLRRVALKWLLETETA